MKGKSKIPKALAEKLLEEEEITEEEASIGENRGQLFVRIPKKIKNRLGIEKGNRFLFRITGKHKQSKLEVEVIK